MRARAILSVLLLTSACDQETRAELAVLRQQVITQEAVISVLHRRVEELADELEKERRERRGAIEALEQPPPLPSAAPALVPVAPKCEGNVCTLTRAEVDALLWDPVRLTKEARVVPVREDRKQVGFKLFAIRAGSLFESIGLQNGDTITELAGFPLTSMDQSIEAFVALRDLDRVVVKGTRGDAPFEITLAVAE